MSAASAAVPAPMSSSSAHAWRLQAKQRLERAIVGSGAPWLALRRREGDVLILAYHNVVPAGEAPVGDRSLHLSQAAFADQLDQLARTHDVVPLSSVLRARPTTGRRPRAVITFDDAYRGAVTAGVAELQRRSLPGTIFIAPAFVGGRSFWWDALTPPDAATVPEQLREQALNQLCGDNAAIRRWAEESGFGARPLPPHARCASEEELLHAARYDGLSVGSHTWSHRNLERLDDAEVREELSRPLAWLEERFERVDAWLACPYGRSSPAVQRLAPELGYAAALLVTGGWIKETLGDTFALPRVNVPAGLSREGFILRAAGLLGTGW